MYGVIFGFEYFYNYNIVYCDFKVVNVFIGDDGEGKYKVKLGDFGMVWFDFEQFFVLILFFNNDVVMGIVVYIVLELLERGIKLFF